MKKLIVYFLFICLLNLFSTPIFAAENNLKIVKDNKKYALIDKKSQNQIFPFEYDKIRKAKYENKVFYIAEKQNYISLYSPDGLYKDFLDRYYQSNKFNSNILFENYPKEAVIIYEQNKKYGIIAVSKGILHISKPLFSKVKCTDENSFVYRLLKISYSPYNGIFLYSHNGNFITLNDFFNENLHPQSPINLGFITENIKFRDNKLISQYQNAYFPNIYIQPVRLDYNLYQLSQHNIYNYIDKNTNFSLKNYPDNYSVQINHHLYILGNNDIKEILFPATDFKSQSSVLKNFTGININFDTQNIIAKKGNWGIIDSYNNVKVPFIYDYIIPLGENIQETVLAEDDKIVLEYKGKDISKYFLVKKGLGIGVIDSNNNIIIPFEYKRETNSTEINNLKAQINKKIQLDESAADRKMFKSELPYLLLDMLLLPLWIIMPYPFSGHIHIDY